MEELFLQILSMSITASYVILLVLIARLLLKKVPKSYSYALWSVVLFRLCCPFSFESMFSLLPVGRQAVSPDILRAQQPQIASGIAALDRAVNAVLPAATPQSSVNPMQIWVAIGAALWAAVAVGLLLYSLLAAAQLKHRLKSAVQIDDNLYEAQNLPTAFVFGFPHAKIYLPAGLSDTEKSYILCHEQTHIKRFDHLVKPLAFLALCVHWFNPLAWVAFFMCGKDMELSCDERVIKELGGGIKQEYSASLLALSTGRRMIGGCPLAFGENDTKGRIKNVLNYKKPALWVAIVAVFAVVAVSVGLLANPKAGTHEPTQIEADFEHLSDTTISEMPATYVIKDSTDSDITNEVSALWAAANNVYDVDEQKMFDMGVAAQIVENAPEYNELKNYDEVVQRIFTSTGIAQLERTMIGGSTMLIQKKDGKTYRMGSWKSGQSYAKVDTMQALEVSENRMILRVQYKTMHGDSALPIETGISNFTIAKHGGHWLVEDYIYPETQVAKQVEPVEKAFFLPEMDAEQQKFNQEYITPILLSTLLMQDWSTDNYTALLPDAEGQPNNALFYAFEDILGTEAAMPILKLYSGKFPEKVIDDVLLSHFAFTAEQLHTILSPYYKADKKIYTYEEEGRGGGPIECAVTGVAKQNDGTVIVEYLFMTNYYAEASIAEKNAYYDKFTGTLTLTPTTGGGYLYRAVAMGEHTEIPQN